MYRLIVSILLLHLIVSTQAQHVALHWYTLKSVAPLDEVSGKEALTRIRQVTADSISTFIDRNDYFSVATHDPIDWPSFDALMTDAGFPLADITHSNVHHDEFVKMGLAYQTALYLLQNPNVLDKPEGIKVYELRTVEYEALSAEHKAIVDQNPQLFSRTP